MSKFITTPLAKDLPENWTDTQYVSPGGTEVGLSEKHGYNYLMKQVNNAQKAAEELGNGMDFMVGVNLLDNWYFPDPVHRRVEKYAVSGAPYYSDTAFTTKVNTFSQASPLVDFNDSYGTYKSSGNNKLYYVKPEDVRDGYAAAGTMVYTTDRWRGHSCTMTRSSRGINITSNTTTSRGYLCQYIVNPSKLAAKTVTLSVLVNSMSGGTAQATIKSETAIDASYPTSHRTLNLNQGMNKTTITFNDGLGNASYPYTLIELSTPVGGSVEIVAIKLELGPYQTLAHQDSTGAWILNEIPNKGLEAVKCNYAPVEIGGIGMLVAPEDIGAASTANTFAVAEVVE